MRLTRRSFLQQSGWALAAWGVSELGGWSLGDRYQQALAAPTSRKLALLVGINQYAANGGLEGCVTDVELQRELLIHRFGFQSADVLTLTDWQATREAVETAFVEHLLQPAKPGDVVVFHFSGLGRTIPGVAPDVPQPSFVMADAETSVETPLVNDLTAETLWLLLRSLKTDRVTTVLDTSHTYPGHALQGNLRIRSAQNLETAELTATELAFQDTLLGQLQLEREQLTPHLRSSLPGLGLLAATPEQVATEIRWDRSSAGLFTATLTQALWQATPASTLRWSFSQVVQQMQQAHQQVPQLSGQLSGRASQAAQPYFMAFASTGAEGVVTEVAQPEEVQLWLGGLPIPVLEQYGVNSIVTALPIAPEGAAIPLQITARDGFTARAKVYNSSPEVAQSSVRVGQIVREALRVLPRNVGLTIALDTELERIERVDAVSALTSVPRVSSAIAGEQPADYLFSRLPSPPTQLAALPTVPLTGITSSAPASVSYGLFSPGHDLMLNTVGEGGEAVKVAVRRLLPTLQTLLATKLLNLTLNDRTSNLGIRAALELTAPQVRPLTHLESGRTESILPTGTTTSQPAELPAIPAGSQVRCHLKQPEAVYSLAIGLDPANTLQWLQTPTRLVDTLSDNSTPEDQAAAIAAATTELGWQIQGTRGVATAYLIFSRAPFTQTLSTLTSQQRSGSSAISGTTISNPTEVAQAVLQDLHQANEAVELNVPDTYVLNVDAWATFRFDYQIV